MLDDLESPYSFLEMETLLFRRDVGTVLCFEDGGRFMDDDGVPGGLWDLNAEGAFSGADSEASGFFEVGFVLRDFAIVDRASGVEVREFFVEYPVETAFETDDGFGGFQVAMDGDASGGLQGIEHALGGVRRGSAEVEVLAKSIRFASFLMQSFE